MIVTTSRIALALASALVLFAPAAADAQVTPKEAQNLFKKAAKSELKLLKDEIKEKRDEYMATLDGVLAGALAAGITREDALFIGIGLTADHVDDLILCAEEKVANMQAFGTSLLLGLGGEIPSGFLVGDCGTADVFVADALLEAEKARAAALKKLKKFAMKLGQELDYFMTLAIPPITLPAAPAPGSMPSPVIPKNVRVDALGAGSDATATSDGKLCVGGTGDPGSMVTVTITGPSGATSIQMVTPEASDCRFKVCFPENAGNLPEGQYSVQVTQGTSSVDTKIGVP